MPQLQRSPVVPILVTLLVVAGVAIFLLWSQSVPGPTVEFAQTPGSLGQQASLHLTATARRGGVRWIEARVQRGAEEMVVASQAFEGAENVRKFTLNFDVAALGLTEGDAFLNIYGADGFWRMRPDTGTPLFSAPIRIDLTPPVLSVASATRYPAQGGTGVCVLSTEAEARVEVRLGDASFPATSPTGATATLRVAFYAVPWNHPETAAITAIATDDAGNQTSLSLPVILKTRDFERGEVNIQEDFVARKAAELLPGVDASDISATFVKINREMRATAAQTKREIGQETDPARLWSQAFQQPRNTRVFSNFAETRDYKIGREIVDTQVHLGFDLASVRQAVVPAANAGRVVFAGPLTIYGNTVIVDHGWGLQSLYAHCSSLSVAVGDRVKQGQELGRTGTTGLAVGDHLHYEVLIRGVPVSPLQWWDERWVNDHVLQVLRDGGILTASR